jgi:hypothetical protein
MHFAVRAPRSINYCVYFLGADMTLILSKGAESASGCGRFITN